MVRSQKQSQRRAPLSNGTGICRKKATRTSALMMTVGKGLVRTISRCLKRWKKAHEMPRGPQGHKRPADVIGNAVRVMRIASSEETEELDAENRQQPSFGGAAERCERRR